MGLITCPECSKKISETAAACPNCGFQLTSDAVSEIRDREQQTARRQGMGCLSALGVLFVLYLIGSFTSGSSSRSSQSKVPSTPNNVVAPKTPGKIEAWVMAQKFVKDRLKSPASADFGGVFSDYQDPDKVVTDLGAGKFRVLAWVDAQNAFGAQIRNRFVCELEYVGNDRWRLLSIDFKD